MSKTSITKIKFVPHLEPVSTGQAACLMQWLPLPDGCKLSQNIASPLTGNMLTPSAGKTVAPP